MILFFIINEKIFFGPSAWEVTWENRKKTNLVQQQNKRHLLFDLMTDSLCPAFNYHRHMCECQKLCNNPKTTLLFSGDLYDYHIIPKSVLRVCYTSMGRQISHAGVSKKLFYT